MPYSTGEEDNRPLRNIKVFITIYTSAHSLTLSEASAIWSVVRSATLTALLLPAHVCWGVKLCRHVPKDFGLQYGRDSADGIAIHCGLGGPGIESRWGRDISHPTRPALGSTHLPGLLGLFPGGKVARVWC